MNKYQQLTAHLMSQGDTVTRWQGPVQMQHNMSTQSSHHGISSTQPKCSQEDLKHLNCSFKMFNHLIQIRGKGERNMAYKATNCYILLWHQTHFQRTSKTIYRCCQHTPRPVSLSSPKAGDSLKNEMLVYNNPHPHHPKGLRTKNLGRKM